MTQSRPTLVQLTLMSTIFTSFALHKLGFRRLTMLNQSRVMRSKFRKKRAFAGYQATQHDVFICAYSKSGTNWAMQIAQQIAYYGEAEFDHITDLVAWPSAPVLGGATIYDKTVQAKAPTGMRVIKTHVESEYVPYDPAGKYFIIIRDPKEAFVSSYHFGHEILSGFGEVRYSPQEWLDLYTSNRFMFDSWAEHTASFWPWRNRDNVLLVTFDEMKRDLPAIVRRVADLMSVTLTQAQFETVVEKSSFSYMKNINSKFTPEIPSFVGEPIKPALIRQGKSGASGDLITPAQQAEIDRFCQAELKRLGSDFPYTDLFKTA